MADNEILSDIRGSVLVITFNRPDHANAMTLAMANQLYNIVKNATTDRGIRAVLLWGAGADFMDSIDMSFYSADMNDALDQANKIVLPYHSAIRELRAMDKPVIAAVQGRVSGSGLSIMLAADLVVAARDTVFNAKFADYGLTPDGGASYFLPRKVGASRAIEILMMNHEFDVNAGERMHLVNRIVEDDKLREEALAWATELAEGPTRAYGGIKKLVMHAFEKDLNAQLATEHSYFGQSTRSFDFREAVKAFFANRPPRFTGS